MTNFDYGSFRAMRFDALTFDNSSPNLKLFASELKDNPPIVLMNPCVYEYHPFVEDIHSAWCRLGAWLMWHKNYWRWLFVRMSGGKYIPLYGEYWDNVQETEEYPSAQIIHEIQEDIRALESAVAYAALCSYRGIIYNEDKNALTYYDSVIKQYKTKLTALQEIS